MTRQVPEKLIYKGEHLYMASEPLDTYIKTLPDGGNLNAPNTACWRGYNGAWKIRDDKLYLIALKAYISTQELSRKRVHLQHFFPGKKEVFADWYTGEL